MFKLYRLRWWWPKRYRGTFESLKAAMDAIYTAGEAGWYVVEDTTSDMKIRLLFA